MARKVEAFRSVFEEALSDIAESTNAKSRCIILSGGVDTCAILAAARKLNITIEAAFTVVTNDQNDNVSPDRGFAVAAAAQHGLNHHLICITADELVATYLPPCVKLLKTFDGMTLRNSLVVAAAFQKASELGYKHVVVGDGADELFGGYSFMWGDSDAPAQWKDKRDKMCANWTFATEALASNYGLVSHSPYMAQKTVDWAIENTERSDCIGVRPIRLIHGGETIEHETGKLILRESYDTVASWRRKDPIEVGSGITAIGKDCYWAYMISDEEFKAEKERLLQKGFVIKDKEHLVNFRAFEQCFGEDGSAFPTKKRLGLGEGCAGCCFEIGDSAFCHICGAFPAQRS
jgi:asparagine synthase (glutamine-hydrolysing)